MDISEFRQAARQAGAEYSRRLAERDAELMELRYDEDAIGYGSAPAAYTLSCGCVWERSGRVYQGRASMGRYTKECPDHT
jgi:hypothetical protein